MRARHLVLALGVLLAGCAVGPDFRHPPAPEVKRYTPAPLPAQTASADTAGGAAQRFAPGADIPGQWWRLFHSPSLNALVERTLRANPSLDAARAALRMAQEAAAAQGGASYPQITASLAPSRQRIPDSLSSPLLSGATLFNLHTAQVNVGYTLDVFGGNRRQVESLDAQAESQRFQLEAADLSLTANVVAAAVQEAGLRAQIAATARMVRINAELLALLRRQLAAGAVAEAAVVAQETALAQAKAALPPLQKALAQTRDLLTALVGAYPDRELPQTFDLSQLRLPEQLPLSLPSKLVEQRPDVRAAEAQARAASAQVGVALAATLPQFTLDAGIGSVATRMADLFGSGSGFWSIAGGVAQPIFEGGALTHRKRAAEAAYAEAMALYRGTVIAAFQNVADTLHALETDADALQAAAAAERASATSLAIVRRQEELGDTDRLSLLAADLGHEQALVSLAQAQANRFADTAALFQALGGGWWNRPETAAARQAVESSD